MTVPCRKIRNGGDRPSNHSIAGFESIRVGIGDEGSLRSIIMDGVVEPSEHSNEKLLSSTNGLISTSRSRMMYWLKPDGVGMWVG